MACVAIVIPARYGSSRFPGKPLTVLAGKTMLQHVYDAASHALALLKSETISEIHILIATEDERIIDHAKSFGAQAVLTSDTCKTGSDRVLEACKVASIKPDIVLNLQGDAPLTPPDMIAKLIDRLVDEVAVDVATPVFFLSWEALDILRESKHTRPFSGTTAIVNTEGHALWFSKNILPAIRNESSLRKSQSLSPVLKHIGLYGYRYHALERFASLTEGYYEAIEGLEQLRMLEDGMTIAAITVEAGSVAQLGVDTPEDAKAAEEILLQRKTA